MPKRLNHHLEQLKKEILLLGSMVEDATNKALLALADRRHELATEVIEGDAVVDAREIAVEEECLKILALHQPVAADLRFVIAAMKVNNDLERVGDLASNLAARAIYLISEPPIPIPVEIDEMADSVRAMLRDSLNALVNRDLQLAHKVLHADEDVDSRHKRIYDLLQARMREQPDHIERLVQMLSVSRYLERMADLATNIAEDVVFMVNGEVIRHRPTG
ncbi:MAG: phosphate signaling complex protein PhoU [Acidobacteriota bacterium]